MPTHSRGVRAHGTRLDPLEGGSDLLGALHHQVHVPPVGGHHPILLEVAQENRALRLGELLRTYTRARTWREAGGGSSAERYVVCGKGHKAKSNERRETSQA